jgi:hypothetical protein
MATKSVGMADLDEEPISETPDEELPLTEEGTPEEKEATLPRSVFGGMDLSNGQTVQMRVVEVGENGVRVEMLGTGEEAPEGAPKGDYQEPNAAIDEMAGGY